MKNIRISCLVAALIFATVSTFSLSAQTAGSSPEATMNAAESKQNLVSLDVLRFFGFYNLSYTRALTPAISLTAQVEVPTNFLLGAVLQESGFGARVEGRYNFAQKNLIGIYAAPVIGFNSSTFRPGSAFTGTGGATGDFSATVTWLSFGVMAGYQFAPFTGLPELMTGLGIGAEYSIISSSSTGTGVPASVPTSSGITYPRIRATIGYAF
jgi:hypothetical protein